VKNAYRHTGVAAGLYLKHLEAAAVPGGITGGEMGLDPREQQADEPRHGRAWGERWSSATASTSGTWTPAKCGVSITPLRHRPGPSLESGPVREAELEAEVIAEEDAESGGGEEVRPLPPAL
jgi:hypothetical protein